MKSLEYLKKKINEIQNWPIDGVNFKDITSLFEDKSDFRRIINALAKPYLKYGVDKVVGIDARGFIVAAPVAYKINAGFCMIRKPGKLPRNTIKRNFSLEYGESKLEMHTDSILPGEKVLLIDDVIATGGTAIAACALIEKLKGEILEVGAVIDLAYLGGAEKLREKSHNVRCLVSYTH